MNNPFFDAHETSLGRLSEHDWRVLSAHHSMFSAYSLCRKLGRKWTVEGFGLTGPLFKTKTAAAEYVTDLVLAEGRHRRRLQWDAEDGKT